MVPGFDMLRAPMRFGEKNMTQEERLKEILAELRGAVPQLDNEVYGKTLEKVRDINPKWARSGFDMADKKEPSRFGWTLENLRWLLMNPDKLQEVLNDAEEIRAKYKYVIFCVIKHLL